MSPNKALIKRWFDEVWNQGSAAAIDQILAPEARMHGLAAEPTIGPEGFKPFHTALRAALSNIRVQIEDMVEEGDKVSLRYTVTADHSGDGFGVQATKNKIVFTGQGVARVRDGKIDEAWNAYDQLALLVQMGVVRLPA